MDGMNVDVQIEQLEVEMEDVENTLLGTGFSEEQWQMIKNYIEAAILHSQWQHLKHLKSLQKLTSEE